MSEKEDKQVVFWNRKKGREEVESIYGDSALRWVYQTKTGQFLAEKLFSSPLVSQVYGSFQSSFFSRFKVQPFIKKFNIPIDEFEPKSYSNFNDFFIRKFKPGERPFVQGLKEMPAFAEARYLAFEQVSAKQTLPVKKIQLSPLELLGSPEVAKPFLDGPVLLARLCPVDYHRFHFPDSGEFRETYRVEGPLHSVNPVALEYRSDILVTNERQVSLLKTENFGQLAFVEVGAICVGKIIQTHPSAVGEKFARGEEKGYFLFGGSTVIVLGENGAWKPDQELLDQTALGRETFVCLGDRVARAF